MTWDWLGEPLAAIDFANTWQREGGAYVDVLRSGDELAEWCRRTGHDVRPVGARAAATRLDEIRAVRDDVFAILRAAFDGRPLPAEPVERINARVKESPRVAQLGRRAGETTTAAERDPIDDLLARVAAETVELVGAGAPGLGFCDAPSCGMFFIRHRPDQRWCGPACGTRARVARHAARHRTA